MNKPEGRSLSLMHRLFMAEDIKSDQSCLTGLYLGIDDIRGADEIGIFCFDTSMEYLFLYTEALSIVGGVCEKIHEEWLDNAWEIFNRGEFATDLNLIYDECFYDVGFHIPGEIDPVRYYMSIERTLGILFAFKPDEMEAVFARTIKEVAPKTRCKYEAYFDIIRKRAFQ